MDDIGPFYFCALRSLIGSLALMIVFLLTDRRATLHKTADPDDPAAKKALEEEHLLERKTLLRGGLICGCVIFIAMNTQQMGLVSVPMPARLDLLRHFTSFWCRFSEYFSSTRQASPPGRELSWVLLDYIFCA